jgi:hypothetical protein
MHVHVEGGQFSIALSGLDVLGLRALTGDLVMARARKGADGMSVVERWKVRVCNNCQTPDVGHACPADRDGIHIYAAPKYMEVVPASQLTGAVDLTDAERERVLWWLYRPVPPGPMKELDEAIIRKFTRGQS